MKASRIVVSLPFALSALFASSAENLQIKVIEGQNSVNHIKTMSAVQPSIQVFDAQGAPVNGAEVTFLLPSAGPGASFKGWLRSEVVQTNQDGRATAVGLQPNREAGQFLIKVSAVSGSIRGSAMITQTNILKGPKPPKQKREPLPCVRSVFGVCLVRADQCNGFAAKR
jgi:hypothetical protein